MYLEDNAFVLRVRKYGEASVLLDVFTSSHGIIRGMCKNSRSAISIGLFAKIVHKARLREHLGLIQVEELRNYGSVIALQKLKLLALQASLDLLLCCLRENDPHPKLYAALDSLLQSMYTKIDQDWLLEYALFELVLLEEIGYGLDLTKCAATDSQEDLTYISPKSGVAVSMEAGEPFKDKLFPLPPFYLGKKSYDIHDIKNSLNITGFFLYHRFMAPCSMKMPASRNALAANI